MSIPRNDPCPCGSGKKYKRCHGVSDREISARPEPSRASALKALDSQLSDRLLRFARKRHGPNWLQDVLVTHGLLEDGELSEAELPFVIPWLLHSMVDAEGRLTLADEWRSQARAASPDEELLLDAYQAAWVSLWEVAEVEPGVGSRLKDVLTTEERFVLDVSSSRTMRRFDTLLAIVLTCDGVSFFGGAHAQPLTPRYAEPVIREARRLCRVRTRPVPLVKLRDPDMQLDLLTLWNLAAENMRTQPPPFLQNSDGDPLLLTKDDFALLAPRDAVVPRLATLTGAQGPEQEGDSIAFAITKAGNAMHKSWDNTVVGRIVVSATRLTVETNSTRRADALRSQVEAHMHGVVRFRLRTEENTAQLVAAAMASGAGTTGREHQHAPPEMALALRQFREQHMKDWLDEAIPALGGLTPRKAARSPNARPKLELLLKEFDQNEARLPEEQRIDLSAVRAALRLSSS